MKRAKQCEITVLGIKKPWTNEVYVFLYDEVSQAEAIRTIDRFVRDPQLSLSRRDAKVLHKRIREVELERKPKQLKGQIWKTL